MHLTGIFDTLCYWQAYQNNDHLLTWEFIPRKKLAPLKKKLDKGI